jgi:hypothetical protein
MAYGVKYRLAFSDVQGNQRKIEILKKDYTGEIFPMICDGEPMTIEWKADDDIYEPLIGSSATLNLKVTNEVTYDNFYEYDEREYQLILYFQETVGVWSGYWKGFITNDIYQEAIITPPYDIQITAIDGLGQLKGFNTWLPDSLTESKNTFLWEFIYQNLAQLGLDFDIWISNDIRTGISANWSNIYEDLLIKTNAYITKDNDILDAKKVLRSILIATNCRIFQSYGRWIIANASSYGDQRIIEGIQSGALVGGAILTAKQAYLNAGSEDIKFYIYNSSGTYLTNLTANNLKTITSQLIPRNSNMVRSVKRPLKKYEMTVDLENKQVYANYNAGFEFDLQYWNAGAGVTLTVGSDFSANGANSVSFTNVLTSGGYTPSTAITCQTFNVTSNQLTLSFNMDVAFDNYNYDGNTTFTYKIAYYVRGGTAGSEYFNAATNTWDGTGTIIWNEVTIECQSFEFRNVNQTLPSNVIYGDLLVGVAIPYYTGFGFNRTYIDNVGLIQNAIGSSRFKAVTYSGTLYNNNKSDLLEHDGIYNYNSDVNDLQNDVILYNAKYGLFFGLKRAQDTTSQKMEQIVIQQRLNDFRSYLKSYEGDFSINGSDIMLSMSNKVYIKFDTFTETDSCIMDSMKFSVKSNIYSIICHIPDNYTDVSHQYRVINQV